jgi:hypothetical protein
MRDFTVRLARKRDIPAVSRFATSVVKSMKYYNKEQMAANIYEMSTKDLKNTLK